MKKLPLENSEYTWEFDPATRLESVTIQLHAHTDLREGRSIIWTLEVDGKDYATSRFSSYMAENLRFSDYIRRALVELGR